MAKHEVIVGNIGTVYSGTDKDEACNHYDVYSNMSESNYGRCASEPVAWMVDGYMYMVAFLQNFLIEDFQLKNQMASIGKHLTC